MAYYPTLVGEIAKRGITKTAIARALGIENRTFYNKLNGVSEFSWDEVRIINDVFFPDMSKEQLFERNEKGEKE